MADDGMFQIKHEHVDCEETIISSVEDRQVNLSIIKEEILDTDTRINNPTFVGLSEVKCEKLDYPNEDFMLEDVDPLNMKVQEVQKTIHNSFHF